MTWLNQTHTKLQDQTILFNPQPSNPNPEVHLGQLNSLGPPFQNFLTIAFLPMHVTNNQRPIVSVQSPKAPVNPTSPNTPFMNTSLSHYNQNALNLLPMLQKILPSQMTPKPGKELERKSGAWGEI